MKLPLSTRLQRMRLALLPALALLCVLGLPAGAHAACGMVDGLKPGSAKLPMYLAQHDEPLFFTPTVVGLWHAVYTNSATNDVFNVSLKTWHDDGTEIESAFLSPGGGNVCMGVWKPTNFRTVKLHHMGWLFNAATPEATATGYFTMDEVVTVAMNGKTYSGTFTFKIWNLDGSATPVEVTGTIAATRIIV